MLISPFFPKKAVFNYPLVIGTPALPLVDKLKILGLQFISAVTRWCHVASVRSTMNSMVGAVNHLGSTLNCDTCLKIFNAFIKPQVTFTLPVWGNADAGCITSMDHTLCHVVYITRRYKKAELDKRPYVM